MVLTSLRSRFRCTGRFHTRYDEWYSSLPLWQQLVVMGTAVSAALWGKGYYAALGVGDALQSLLLVMVPLVLFASLSWLFAVVNRRTDGD